jgi:PAS domain S-box-containing protein
MDAPARTESGNEASADKLTGVSRRFLRVLEPPTTDDTASRMDAADAQRYRDVMDALGVAVYTTDAAGVITYYNQAAAEFWGRHPEIGKDEWCGSWKIYHPDGVTVMPHGECPMAICLKENRPVRGAEAIAERPDGSRVYFQPFPTPLRDDSGKLVGAINILVDITERKRAEEGLRESESRLSVAMGAGQMGSWEWRMDDNHVRWSEALERIHGLEPGTFAGTFEAFLADVHPDDRASVQETIGQSLETGTHEIEYRIILPDGQMRWVLGRGQLIRDEAGKPSRMVGVCMDITERKETELAALRLGALVESSDDAIISKNVDGTITSWNGGAERIFGYAANEVIGRSIRIIIPPDRQHEEDDVLNHLRNGEYVQHFQTVRRRKDGSHVDISLSVSPIRMSSGEIVGASSIARDISEQKRSEEMLRQSEERLREERDKLQRSLAVKDEFLGLVSHELRTPITTILGNSILLQRRAQKLAAETRGDIYRDLTNEAERLERIIENLLLLTRVDIGEQAETEPLRLQALITEAVESFRRRSPEREVVVEADGGTPIVLGVAEFVKLVLENLITNADKYSADDKPIVISTRADGEAMVEVCVRDYGIGLEDGETEQVFIPFYRADAAKSRAKGIGLGLAVCKRVLEVQGGSIRAIARSEGGCDFVFNLKAYRTSGPDAD